MLKYLSLKVLLCYLSKSNFKKDFKLTLKSELEQEGEEGYELERWNRERVIIYGFPSR